MKSTVCSESHLQASRTHSIELEQVRAGRGDEILQPSLLAIFLGLEEKVSPYEF
jgi:hypothetical protein